VKSPAPSPAYAGTKASLSRGQSQSLDTSSMEAGDEEIDWDHTRMLSIGFFPSISTDQDVAKMGMGKLNARVEGVAPGAGEARGRIHGGADGARAADSPSRKIAGPLLPLPWSKPKDTPPRPDSPTGNVNVKTFRIDSRSSGRTGSPLRAATRGDRDRMGIMGRGDAAAAAATAAAAAAAAGSAAAAQSGSREETERRRRW
ncbi:unnamed protein product, partial [Ectocarpus sp. 12 AP-2014]